MEDLEEKLGAVLNNPQMMQQLMSMAQALGSNPGAGGGTEPPPKQEPPRPDPSGPEFDPAMLQRLFSLTQQTGIDQRQRTLLNALEPYLTHERIAKLEKAMKAAKMAKIASFALGRQG